MNLLAIIGLNHKSAPLSIRERYVLPPAARSSALQRFSAASDELVLLCTCNRTEFFYNVHDPTRHATFQTEVQALGDLSDDEFHEYFYSYRDRQALTHLFRIAAGLDSMIPGESQILGQVKSAFDESFQLGLVKENFHRIYQRMLNAAKTVRSRTRLGHGPLSVGSVAVQLACNIFENMSDKSVLLVGAGEMCEIAADHFHRFGIQTMVVANRSRDRATKLAEKYGGTHIGLDALPQAVANADVLLSSVSDQPGVISAAMVGGIMDKRRSRPLFIIDIAVPRNVEASVNQIRDVYVYNIDDLQKLVDDNLQDRVGEMAKGEKLLQRNLDQFIMETPNGEVVGPLIQSLQSRVEGIKERELKRLYNRTQTLTADDRRQVEKSVNAIVNKILHDPIISLRRGLSDEEEDSGIARIFKDFFNL